MVVTDTGGNANAEGGGALKFLNGDRIEPGVFKAGKVVIGGGGRVAD